MSCTISYDLLNNNKNNILNRYSETSTCIEYKIDVTKCDNIIKKDSINLFLSSLPNQIALSYENISFDMESVTDFVQKCLSSSYIFAHDETNNYLFIPKITEETINNRKYYKIMFCVKEKLKIKDVSKKSSF